MFELADVPSFRQISSTTAADVASLADLGESPVIAAMTLDEQGQHCLAQACAYAVRMNRTVVALHIVHETDRDSGRYRRHDPGQTMLPLSEVARRLLRDQVTGFLSEQPDFADLVVHWLALPGIPETRIVEIANLSAASLVVMGGTPRLGIARVLWGSVTGTTLLHAQCPVLVIDREGQPVHGDTEPEGDFGDLGPSTPQTRFSSVTDAPNRLSW